MSKFEKKYLFYYHYSATLSIVIALLLFSETRSQPSGDYAVQARLRNMYEEALVNSNESLYTLQRMYFNPSPRSKYRSSFCLQVNVTIDNPPPLDQQCNATFVDGHFISQYVLHLLSDDGYTSRLADFLSYTGTDSTFYEFDPTFYATMQALAISIDTDTSNVVVYDNSRDYSITIDISGQFEHMPCRDDAVDAMKMLLMWVSSIHASIKSERWNELGMAVQQSTQTRIAAMTTYKYKHPYTSSMKSLID